MKTRALDVELCADVNFGRRRRDAGPKKSAAAATSATKRISFKDSGKISF